MKNLLKNNWNFGSVLGFEERSVFYSGGPSKGPSKSNKVDENDWVKDAIKRDKDKFLKCRKDVSADVISNLMILSEDMAKDVLKGFNGFSKHNDGSSALQILAMKTLLNKKNPGLNLPLNGRWTSGLKKALGNKDVADIPRCVKELTGKKETKKDGERKNENGMGVSGDAKLVNNDSKNQEGKEEIKEKLATNQKIEKIIKKFIGPQIKANYSSIEWSADEDNYLDSENTFYADGNDIVANSGKFTKSDFKLVLNVNKEDDGVSVKDVVKYLNKNKDLLKKYGKRSISDSFKFIAKREKVEALKVKNIKEFILGEGFVILKNEFSGANYLGKFKLEGNSVVLSKVVFNSKNVKYNYNVLNNNYLSSKNIDSKFLVKYLNKNKKFILNKLS